MATVNVSIEGLGIICFNREGAEVTFLRHQGHGADHHELKLIARGAGCNVNRRDIAADADIRFVVENPSIRENQLKRNERFHRLSGLAHPNNTDDLNWIINLQSGDFHPTNLRRKRHPHMPLSKLILPNARFYNDRHFTVNDLRRECFLSRRIGEPFDERFGLVGSALGATFSADRVRLFIGSEEVCIMQQNTTYQIGISNIRRTIPGSFLSDFSMYYEVLAPQDGLKFDFHIEQGAPRPHGHDFHVSEEVVQHEKSEEVVQHEKSEEAVQHEKSAEFDNIIAFRRSPDPAMCNIPQLDVPRLEDLPPED
jgi:hypothetical protein